ncbi:hypothetical protein NDU88_003974, partial [Pleurodeles waltl]
KPSFESRQVPHCCQVTNASAAILGYFRCGRGSVSTSPGRVWIGSERPITNTPPRERLSMTLRNGMPGEKIRMDHGSAWRMKHLERKRLQRKKPSQDS